jgi:hypothetical protein
MSEYQRYEWQTIDRPLTTAERAAVSKLSSHIEVSSSHAWVEYSWGDFKHDPIQVLARYFDAFLYYANWGAQRLAFRFPKHLLDAERLQPYLWAGCAELQSVDDYYILSISAPDQESPEWEDLAGNLDELLPLRSDILQGDLRLLYLGWLLGAGADGYGDDMDGDEDVDDEGDIEPPVPPGIGQLSPALDAFAGLMGVDPYLVQAAAQASLPLHAEPEPDLETALTILSSAEGADFLRRLLRGEANLQLTLRRRLLELTKTDVQPEVVAERRTFGALVRTAEELRRSAAKRAKARH